MMTIEPGGQLMGLTNSPCLDDLSIYFVDGLTNSTSLNDPFETDKAVP